MYKKQTQRLVQWVESNQTIKGLFVSNANHPIWGVENTHILPHTFHYYGIIISYLNLYNNLNNEVYLQKAEEAGDVLCSLQKRTGQYKFDTFEFNTTKPTGLTLIHNALPSIALLELYKRTKKTKYFKTAKKNIAWFYCRLWNGKYLTGCINQDICAAEALANLYSIKRKEVYKTRAKKIANKSLSLQIQEGSLAGGFIRGFNERNLCIPWYDAKTAVAYHNIDAHFNEEKYKDSTIQTAKFLKKSITKKGLIHWHIKKSEWETKKEPHLIAPTGEVYMLWDKLNMKAEKNLLKFQNKDGSFPLSQWYKDDRKKTNLGWNQFMLLYLTSKANKDIQ